MTRSEPTCRFCGCTDLQACPGGCSWIAPEVCSACADKRPPLTKAAEVREVIDAGGHVRSAPDSRIYELVDRAGHVVPAWQQAIKSGAGVLQKKEHRHEG